MHIHSALLVIALSTCSAALSAQTTNPAKCSSFTAQWDNLEKDMAATATSGITDTSVPRATLRKLEDLENLTRAEMLYQMMKENKCPLPEAPPSKTSYLLAALKCENEKLRQRSMEVAECNRSNWTKNSR